MKTFTLALTLLALSGVEGLALQDGKKWKAFQFAGNEKFDYKVVQIENEEKKETGFSLDLRKKGEDQFEVTWSNRNLMKKDQGAEILMGGVGFIPILLFNPGFSAFFEQLELQEGEKMAILGFGTIKVGAKETVGGRTGFPCTLVTPQDGKDVVAFQWTIDPELALPIRSVTYENGKEKARVELLSYKKD